MSAHPRRSQSHEGGSGGGQRGHVGGAAPPLAALFAEMLRAARELLAVRSPLDAELMTSELLGTWWGMRWPPEGTAAGPAGRAYRPLHGGSAPRRGASRALRGSAAAASAGRGADRRGAGVEQLVGEGLVDYAARQRNPAALALLTGIACLGTPRQAAKAERAALDLIEGGVPCPGWAEHLGAVTSGECYLNPDALGDTDEVICVFSYDGEEQHALVTVVDYNADGMIRDGWVTSHVAKLLDHCRDARSQRGAEGKYAFRQVDAGQARHMLQTALAVTDAADHPLVSESFPSYHAFIRARIRALPPYRGRPSSGTGARRQAWSKDRRAMLAAEFLASDEAEDLSDRGAASHCADRIIDYGCDRDFGRPVRMSPAKVEAFLLGWLPRKVMLSFAEQDAMPHVLAAWVRWAGRRRGLADAVITEMLETVFNSMGMFAQAYRNLAESGLDYALIRRLLPDGDLEALPRRAFAFPVLEGWHAGADLGGLDPADPEDRRALLAADHATPSPGGAGRHVERHLVLADRLWRGDPPELWEAAQRLLDAGQDRHLVLHALMAVLDHTNGDEAALIAVLRELDADE
ncbi:MAG: hypothetical protein JO132_06075 [Streptosporangiaceae bacterium]|nr:hypothetical protein [Streptosporangiaceae bacterium]